MTDLKTPEQWSIIKRVRVMDPDGWRGVNGLPWETPITEAEFEFRLGSSTIRMLDV